MVRCCSAIYFHSPRLFFSQVCFDQNCTKFFFHIRKPSHSFWKPHCRPQLHNFTPRIFSFVMCVRNMKMNTSVVLLCFESVRIYLFSLNNSLLNGLSVGRWGGGVLYDTNPELLSTVIHAFRERKTISIFYFWMLVNDLHIFFTVITLSICCFSLSVSPPPPPVLYIVFSMLLSFTYSFVFSPPLPVCQS